MDKLFPNKTITRPYYDVLKGGYPVLSQSSNIICEKDVIDSYINVPSYWTKVGRTNVNVSLDEAYNDGDIDGVLVKETALENITKCSLRIGGMDILELDKEMINEFCDKHTMENGDIFVNLFSKFIEQIPIKSCSYHTVYVCFEYSEYDTQVSYDTRLVFKYDNYDARYDEEIGYPPESYEEVTTQVYHGLTPDLKLIPSEHKCQDMISFLQKYDYIEQPCDISLSRYIIFDAQKECDVNIAVDDTTIMIAQEDLYFMSDTNKALWKVPHNKEKGYVRVEGTVLTSNPPIRSSLRANKLRITSGMAGAMSGEDLKHRSNAN